MWSQSTRRISEREGFQKGRRVGRGCNKRPCFGDNISPFPSLSLSRVFLAGLPGRERPFLFSPFPSFLSESYEKLSFFFSLSPPSHFQPSLSSINKQHGFLPPTSAALPAPAFRAQPSFLPLFIDPWALPLAPIHATPNLNPIFHITSRKSYSAVLGRAGSNATHGSRTKERRNIFIFSLPSLLRPPSPPPSSRPK